MIKYRNEKPIEKLDPIPAEWGSADKARFLEHGFLAFSGETPEGVMRTKKVSLEILSKNKPGLVAWVGTSLARTSDGVFTLVETDSSEAGKSPAEKSLVINNGTLIAAGGWYQIQADIRVETVNGNNVFLNEYRDVLVTLAVNGTDVDASGATIDMSMNSDAHCVISSIIYVAYNDTPVSFRVSGIGQDNLVSALVIAVSAHKLNSATEIE